MVCSLEKRAGGLAEHASYEYMLHIRAVPLFTWLPRPHIQRLINFARWATPLGEQRRSVTNAAR